MDDDGIETDAWAADEGAAAGAPLPASSAWRQADPHGHRQFFALGDVALEADLMGARPGVVLAWCWRGAGV